MILFLHEEYEQMPIFTIIIMKTFVARNNVNFDGIPPAKFLICGYQLSSSDYCL